MLKCVISKDHEDIETVLKARGKRGIADANRYCKMTQVVALDGVTSFFNLEDVNKYM